VGEGGVAEFSSLTLTVVGARVEVTSAEHGQYQWNFEPPTGGMLQPGLYDSAIRHADAARPGLDVFGNGRGCNETRGQFIVDDATYDGLGVLVSFSARYEMQCENREPAIFGQVSYNSIANYRVRRLTPNGLSFVHPVGGTSPTKRLTMTNYGPSSLHVSSVVRNGFGALRFKVAANTCTGSTLLVGQRCHIDVYFAPNQAGTVTAKLTIVDDVTFGGRDITLTGRGFNPGASGTGSIRVDDGAVDFGSGRVGTYNPDGATLTFTNLRASAVRVRSIVSSGFDFFGYTDCGRVIKAGASCHVWAYFSPTERGRRLSTLVLNASGGSAEVRLAGTGTLGYYLARANGEVWSYGDAVHYGNTAPDIPAPIIDIATTPNGEGYWLAGTDGSVYAGGNAAWKGWLRGRGLNRPIVGMSPTPAGKGYWLVASDGGIFAFGDAKFRGSTGAIALNQPIVGMASTVSGKGYWLVASDGGIFAFGDAKFYGSTGALTLNKPIVGMTVTPSGRGYWMVASDGGIFAFGDAKFYGSTGAINLTSPIVGMEAAPDGKGYWFVARDGGLFAFGPGVVFYGSLGESGFDDVVAMVGTAPPLNWLYATSKPLAASTKRDSVSYGSAAPHRIPAR
jgi:hypothetical protein